MSNLLEWKEKLQTFYATYSAYIDRGIRFVLALVSFMLISSNIGFMTKLANPLISVGMAAVCALLPMVFTAFAAAGLMLVHIFSLSMEMAAIAAGILAVMFIFYFRCTPKKAIILLMTPIAFAFKVPLLIPIAYGLVGAPVYVVPVACGTIVFYLINYIKTFAKTINASAKSDMMALVVKFAKQIFQSREMWIAIVAMTLCLLLVYALRRLSVDHSWEIAIVSGAVTYIIVLVVGNFVFDIEVNYLEMILGSIVSVALSFGLELMIFSVDYARTEYLQFEDDEYYYYVKAIPKVSVAAPEKQVKRINKRQETEVIDTEAVNQELGNTTKFSMTDDAELDKIIEQELMNK